MTTSKIFLRPLGGGEEEEEERKKKKGSSVFCTELLFMVTRTRNTLMYFVDKSVGVCYV
jgi:hypothetical protein